MAENSDLKPIEEIKSGEPPPAPSEPKPPETTPPEVAAETPKTPPVPPSAPPPPPAAPANPPAPPEAPLTPSAEPGRRAVIKRVGGEGGWVKYAIGALAVLLIGAGVFYYFFYQVTFEINPSPAPDKILLDNNQVKPGTYRVRPGVHTLDIEKQGYISYISAKKFSFGEHIVLNFRFQNEKSPTLSVDAGRLPSASSDKNLLFFFDKNSIISVLDLTDKSGKISPLSAAQYPTARIMKMSRDATFALVVDDEAIKIINFNKTDLVHQTENKLPPLVSQIHSVTWNNNASQYFPESNSKLLYDLQTSSGWDVYLSNLSHTTADIILQIDPHAFPNLNLDWGENPSKVLVTGGEIGVLDVTKRDYQKIASDKQFIWGKWGPGGDRAVAVDKDGGAWLVQNNALTRLPFNSGPNLIDFIDGSNIAAAVGSRPVRYNFDTRQLLNYAEVKDLSEATSLISRSDVFYFETIKGIFGARFEQADYK